MVTRVLKLVDLLAITFGGDLMDSLTNSERRVSFWQQDAQETLSYSIKIGLVIKCFEKGCSRDHLLINTSEKEQAACSDGHVGDGQSPSKVPRKLSWCGIYSHMARDCGKNAEHVQNNQTSGWSGTDEKPKASLARTNPPISREKASLARANARTEAMERVNNTA